MRSSTHQLIFIYVHCACLYWVWILLQKCTFSTNFTKRKSFWCISLSIKNKIRVEKRSQSLGEVCWRGNCQCVGILLSQRENKRNQERAVEISNNILLAETLVLTLLLRLVIISVCLFPKFCLTKGRFQRSQIHLTTNFYRKLWCIYMLTACQLLFWLSLYHDFCLPQLINFLFKRRKSYRLLSCLSQWPRHDNLSPCLRSCESSWIWAQKEAQTGKQQFWTILLNTCQVNVFFLCAIKWTTWGCFLTGTNVSRYWF